MSELPEQRGAFALGCSRSQDLVGGWLFKKWIYFTPCDYSLRWANYESNVITFLQIPFALKPSMEKHSWGYPRCLKRDRERRVALIHR